MIRFDNVSKRYTSGHEGLSNVSFNMEAGEMAFLTGHSGAGKSTLLKLIGLLEHATRGQVMVDGRNLGKVRAILDEMGLTPSATYVERATMSLLYLRCSRIAWRP